MHGLNLENWQEELAQAKEAFNLGRLTASVKEHHLLNPVIVDSTSSQAVADQYADFFARRFPRCHAGTKRPTTSSMDYYPSVASCGEKSWRKFWRHQRWGLDYRLLENPKSLNAGDEPMKFSGILSGSLSYIFGKLDEGMSSPRLLPWRGKWVITRSGPDEMIFLDMDVALFSH